MHPQDNTILHCAVPVPIPNLFDYLPPKKINSTTIYQIGQRVMVPFGRRTIVAVIVEISTNSEIQYEKLKTIVDILDTHPILSEQLIQLCQWASRYYHHPIGEVVLQALPKNLRLGHQAQYATQTFWFPADNVSTSVVNTLKKAHKQKLALEYLLQHPQGLSTAQCATQDIQQHTLSALEKKGLLEKIKRESANFSITKSNSLLAESPLPLNSEQQQAINQLNQLSLGFHCSLLDGITGSGKTEVYMQWITAILEAGKQIIILVPEINLTPQTIERFKARFNRTVVALHSSLTDQERLHAWLAAKRGHADIIIGTRSTIFTQTARLGAIIIDEEHDVSFKQQDGFLYSARDLAIVRAKQENIPIVLGSATPSIESWYNCQQKKYHYLCLSQRAGSAVLPKWQLIDIRAMKLTAGLSQPLINLITETLQRQEQVLLFKNQRGYAPTLLCHHCGWVAQCRHCEARLTYHAQEQLLICHHCSTKYNKPHACESCKKDQLLPLGQGTERLEETLSQLFPQYPILRIDRDTTRRKQAMSKFLHDIKQNQATILIGTQMIAKGHHFPQVTLAAVVDIDSGLLCADFRGTEHIAQLTMQVAGRAGRKINQSTICIQTRQPQHPLLISLVEHGYHGFITKTLEERRDASWPPFSFLALVRAESQNNEHASDFLSECKQNLLVWTSNSKKNSLLVLGPVPAPLKKRAGRFRLQLLLQSQHRSEIQQAISQLLEKIHNRPRNNNIRWAIDIDPIELN